MSRKLATSFLESVIVLFYLIATESNAAEMWRSYTDARVNSVAISGDGSYIVTGTTENRFDGDYGQVFVFNKDSANPVWSFSTNPRAACPSVDISGDGNYIVVVYGGQLYLFNRTSNTPIWKFEGISSMVAISQDGNYVVGVSTSWSNPSYTDLYLFQRNSNVPLWHYRIEEPSASVVANAIAISSDGNYMVVGTGSPTTDGYMIVFSKDSNVPLWMYHSDKGVSDVALSADGRYITAANWSNLYLFEIDSNVPIWQSENGAYTTDISADGSKIAVGSWGSGEDDPNKVYLYDVSSNLPIWEFVVGYSWRCWVRDVKISSDGSYLTAGDENSLLHIFDCADSIPREIHDLGGSIYEVVISSSGNYIASGNWFGEPLPDGDWTFATYLFSTVSTEPDFSIMYLDCLFEPPNPTTVDTVSITATTHNYGADATNPVVVRFFDGNPKSGGMQIGEDRIIGPLSSYESEDATVFWNTAGLGGLHRIYVVIDPNNEITETSEANNIYYWVVPVGACNLAIKPNFISFDPDNPIVGDSVTITAQFWNNGTIEITEPLTVQFFDGDPTASGIQIGYDQVVNDTIPSNSMAEVSIIWNTHGAGAGQHLVYVILDPYNDILENYETDNAAFNSIDIAPITGVDEPYWEQPDKFCLFQNYPNPFNPTTTVCYHLPESGFTTIEIFNIAGQLIETLVREHKNSGFHSVEWNTPNAGSGIYFYRIKIGDFTDMKKCVKMK